MWFCTYTSMRLKYWTRAEIAELRPNLMQGKKRKERKESEIKGKAIYSGLSERKKKGQK